MQQKMARLTAVRVNPYRPFACSSIDYAGPISILLTKSKGTKSVKGYIALPFAWLRELFM